MQNAEHLAEAYAPVWQTWNLLCQRPSPTSQPLDDGASNTSHPVLTTRSADLRERMQIARIQARLTIHELAQRVRCDVETLASFERGEGVVNDEVQRRLCKELRLT